MGWVFGIDVGGSSCQVGLFGQEGNLLFQSHFPTGVECESETFKELLSQEMEKALGFLSLDRKQVQGIGIGLPGPVTEQRQVHGFVNLSWENFDLVSFLEESWQVPVLAENDANLAALGEVWKGEGVFLHSFVFLTLGTGIGGGIILHDQLLRGERGGAGELGHMPIMVDQNGKIMDFESLASARAMVNRAKKSLWEDQSFSSLRDLGASMTSKAIFKEARKGDLIASRVVQETADDLGRGLACIAGVLDPQAFILGGGMSLSGDLLLKPTISAFQKYVFSPLKDTPILLSRLGDRAGMFGAAMLILSALARRRKSC